MTEEERIQTDRLLQGSERVYDLNQISDLIQHDDYKLDVSYHSDPKIVCKVNSDEKWIFLILPRPKYKGNGLSKLIGIAKNIVLDKPTTDKKSVESYIYHALQYQYPVESVLTFGNKEVILKGTLESIGPKTKFNLKRSKKVRGK